jgi:hypothetical protein
MNTKKLLVCVFKKKPEAGHGGYIWELELEVSLGYIHSKFKASLSCIEKKKKSPGLEV